MIALSAAAFPLSNLKTKFDIVVETCGHTLRSIRLALIPSSVSIPQPLCDVLAEEVGRDPAFSAFLLGESVQNDDPEEEHERLRRLLNDDVTLERTYYEIRHHFQGRAATSIIEALMVGLRERGTAALKEPKVQRRLGELSAEQLREVIARLIKLRPQCRAISDELLLQLEEHLP